MRSFLPALLCLAVFCLTACSASEPGRRKALERAAAALQNDVVELGQRMAELEQRLGTVNTDLATLKYQPYPVKTTRGGKTNYVAAAPAAVTRPAPPAPQAPIAADPSLGTPASPRQDSGWLSSSAPPPAPRRQSAAPSRDRTSGPGGTAMATGRPSSPGPVPNAAPAPPVQGPRTLVPAGGQTSASAQAAAGAGDPVALALPPENLPSSPPPSPGPVPNAAPVPPVQGPRTPVPAGRQAGVPAQPVSADKVGGEEAAIYNKALAEFNAGRYAPAATGFTDLLLTYPSGRYAPNAGYWLGESLYGQQRYGEALAQFREVSGRFPQHHKAPDAMFKAGLCYSRLGDRESADRQFRALASEYPGSPAAALARQRGFIR
jgi:tol-pal system protein YbgF